MEKVSFYGLGGSGKSCYIYAMTQALSGGIRFNDGQIMTVRCPEPRQLAKLHKSFQQMINGSWPAGNVESVDYRFCCRLALSKQMEFEIKDYRGGLLSEYEEDDDDSEIERKKVFDSFKGSNVLLFFIGSDIVKLAMKNNPDSVFSLEMLNALYENYREETNDAKTPVMLVLTKSDLLSDSEKMDAKDYLMNTFKSFFGAGTDLTAAMTMVTLGRNLSNIDGELEGELIINASAGNIQIPVLYSLFCVISERIEEATGKLASAQGTYYSAQNALSKELTRSAFARFFDSNEKSIRERISSANNLIEKEKDNLAMLSDTLSRIKPLLLSGADIYINGIKQ